MDFDIEEQVTPERTVIALFGVSVLAVYLLLTAIPTSAVSQDIAGLGTYKSVSTVSGQCEYVVAVSRVYSSGVVSNAAWGPNQFFTETDTLRYSYYPGGSPPSCTGGPTVVTSSVGPYPITPAMVQLGCGSLPRTCSYYPKNIFTAYNSLYSSIMSGGSGGFVPLLSGGLANGNPVLPSNIVSWEAIAS